MYYLIVTIVAYKTGVAVTPIPFGNFDACNSAARAMLENTKIDAMRVTCVPYWLDGSRK